LHSPNAIGWTEAPEEIKILRNQRIRWHRGLGESLFSHKDIFFNNSLGMLGFLAYPFALFFQFFSPILQVSAYIYFFLFFSFGLIGLNEMLLFILVSIFFGILISFLSAIIDQRMFKTWSKNNYLILFLGSVIENIGYRQLNLFWRCVAIFNLFFYSGYNWREMSRRGNNQNIG
jgi:cellulose synthase/poly-beta-1,6-N-acetylglucosamine synthase-like glycosyltransferase